MIDLNRSDLIDALEGGVEGVDSAETASLLAILQRTKGTGEQVAGVMEGVETQEDPLLTLFKKQLSGKVDEAKFVKAMTPEKLASARKLKDPEIAWVKGGEIVITDGCDEVAEETIGMNYLIARKHCVDNGFQMFTKDEYERLQECPKKFEASNTVTWIESGDNPSSALRADWDQNSGKVDFFGSDPRSVNSRRGVRRSLRVKLEI